MKKIIAITLTIFMISSVLAQKNNFTVKGNIKNCTDEKGSLTIWKGDNSHNEKLVIENGKFIYEGEAQEPMMVRLSFNQKGVNKELKTGGFIPTKCSYIWFLVYPGAKVTINGKLTDFAEAYPSGDAENKILSKLTSTIYPIMNEGGNLIVRLDADTVLTIAEKRAQLEDGKRYDREVVAAMKQFMEKHSASYAGLWFMTDMMSRRQLSPQDAEYYLAKVTDKRYTSLKWYELIKNRIESVKYQVGNRLMSLKSNQTYDNKPFCISSLKGKYVILDFWGSWCAPCMDGMGSMRQFRDTHSDKLEIVGIAKDKTELWKRAIRDRNLNWVHILNGEGEEDYVSKFNVTGYPTKILIGIDGTILHRESGESAGFYKKVEQLINEDSK